MPTGKGSQVRLSLFWHSPLTLSIIFADMMLCAGLCTETARLPSTTSRRRGHTGTAVIRGGPVTASLSVPRQHGGRFTST